MAVGALVIGVAAAGLVWPTGEADPGASTDPTADPSPDGGQLVDIGVGATWTRVELPDAGATMPGGADWPTVIGGSRGAIAWGGVHGDGPRVWTTADGESWESAAIELPDDADPDFQNPGDINDIVAGAPGYVAVGFYYRQGVGHTGLVWTSVDGRSWSLVPDQASFEHAIISTVLPWRGELLAFGHLSGGPSGGATPAVAWASADGRTWTRLELVLPDRLTMGGVVAVGDSLWATPDEIGDDVSREWTTDTFLASTDGRTWVLSDLPYLAGRLSQASGSLVSLVRPLSPDSPVPPEARIPGVYLSTDGATWRALSADPSAVGYDLIRVGEVLVMVGDDAAGDIECFGRCGATGWRSLDGGVTWQAVQADGPGGTMMDVAAFDGGLVAVGLEVDTDGVPSAAAWVSIWARDPPGPNQEASPTPLPDSVELPGGTIAVTRGSVGEEQWIDLVDPADPAATSRLVEGADPSWTPDGDALVYACPVDGNEGDFSGICSVDVTVLGATPTLLVSEGDRPSVSPDGTRMTIHRGMIDLGGTWMSAMDGSGLRELGPGDFDRWSPDGLWILGMSELTGSVALRDDESGAERALVAGRGPAWSPDGRLIAFAYSNETAGSVRTVDPVSGTVDVLFTAPVGDHVGALTWLPDGRPVFSMDGDLWRLDAGSDRPTRLTAGLRIGVDHLADPLATAPDG